ncbi:MAG: sigma-70 family RNA polymerase sigma factor [Bacteroidetes bacterium]|nr:sigma-70 family RNA polymerase sigma factor [Bacteroidota bacterium]
MDLRDFKIQVFPLKDKLFRLAKRLLNDPEEAQDIVQEAFIKLWNRRETLNEYRSVEALAVVTTRNLCLDKLKAKKYPAESIDRLKADIPDMGSDLEKDKELIALTDKIKEIIGTLPEQMKTIMQLRDIEGYDFEEIAEVLGMNENTIRVNLSRARKKVREIMINKKIYEFQRN